MKRTLMILGLVFACLVVVAALFLYSCRKSMAGHGDYHLCQMNREMLDMARYWYALDNGMTNPPPVEKQALASYVTDQNGLTCLGGGTYTINPVNQRVVCSIPQHMRDTCLGNHAPPDAPTHWMEEFPLDYRKSERWWQTMIGTQEGTILRMSGASILFKGLQDWGGGGWGTMEVGGTGTSQGTSSSGGREVTTSYANGLYTMSFAGHVLRITDRGHTLEIDGKKFDLSGIRPTIVVETNGVATVQESEHRPNQVPDTVRDKLADPAL